MNTDIASQSNIDPSVLARAAQVKLMVFDVDGILTDGSLYYGPEGEAIKRFNVLDGQGIRLLENAGIATAIISARQSKIVETRAQDLHFKYVIQGAHDKRSAFEHLLMQANLDANQCGFIGDDVIDLPILTRVAFAVSVPNAHIEVRNRVHWVTHTTGGNGAAREVCDLLLKAHSVYDKVIERFLN